MFLAAPSARAFDVTIHRKKAPRHCVQVKHSLISIFLEITSLLGLLNCSRQNRQDRACRIELADLGLRFPLVTSILPLALQSHYTSRGATIPKSKVKGEKSEKGRGDSKGWAEYFFPIPKPPGGPRGPTPFPPCPSKHYSFTILAQNSNIWPQNSNMLRQNPNI